VRRLRDRQTLKGLAVDGRFILMWMCDGEAWTGKMSLSIGRRFGLL
jgi:hypothetical protein